MRRFTRNITVLLSPFLLMIVVNEIVRPTIKEKPYSIYGVTTMNSLDKDSDKCSWACHNSTTICKQKHVKYLKPYFDYSDPVYFGIIGILHGIGYYSLANIIFLVILFPSMIWIFIIKSLNIQDRISKLKQKK